MKGFIATMAMVTGGVILIATFNNGSKSIENTGAALDSVVNEQSFKVNTTPPAPEQTSDLISPKKRIKNRIISISHNQFARKMDSGEEVELKSLDGRSITITRESMNRVKPGIYIARKNNRVYRMIKK